MDFTNPTIQSYLRLLEEVGKATINSLYPEEFEFYMVSLELVDYTGKTVDFLIFPVNPTSISEKERSIKTMDRTAGGITVLKSANFNPIDIELSGTFGRRFKFLIGRDAIDAVALRFGENVSEFSKQIKTGYGVSRILQNILQKSKTVDEQGNPYKLYYYNLGFGSSYLVELEDRDYHQAIPDSNMMVNYSIRLTGIAPINSSVREDSKSSLTKLTTESIIMKSVSIAYRQAADGLQTIVRGRKILTRG